MKNKILNKIKFKKIKIAVIGLGYVGLNLLIKFAKKKLNIVGIDKNIKRISLLKDNKSPISYIKNKEISSIKKFTNYSSNLKDIMSCEFIIICLPTPLDKKNKPDLSHLIECMEKIKKFLQKGQTIVLESTTYPGTTEDIILKNLKNFTVGKNFFLGYSPEREDPGSKKFNIYNTPKIVSGYTKNCLKIVNSLYSKIVKKTVISKSIKNAEASKIFENIYRSVNIALVNEMRFLLETLKIDIDEIIDLAKTKPFGYSEFRPGPGVGGHCIPIDPLYLSWIAEKHGYKSKFIKLASFVNIKTTKLLANKIIDNAKNKKNKKILMVGLSYKKNIDDTRESASIKILNILEKKGFEVYFFDKFVKDVKINNKARVSIKNDYKLLKKFSITIIGTDHDYFNYKKIFTNSNLIIDLRNKYKFKHKKILKF
jgi:UDP-N-acetyl-D-glucosamine dehydrogenase